jgi:hypothetical protein
MEEESIETCLEKLREAQHFAREVEAIALVLHLIEDDFKDEFDSDTNEFRRDKHLLANCRANAENCGQHIGYLLRTAIAQLEQMSKPVDEPPR